MVIFVHGTRLQSGRMHRDDDDALAEICRQLSSQVRTRTAIEAITSTRRDSYFSTLAQCTGLGRGGGLHFQFMVDAIEDAAKVLLSRK